MGKKVGTTVLTLMLGLPLALSAESLEVGQTAPDFTLTDSQGKTYRLSDFRGKKKVVIEMVRSGSW